MQAQSLIKHVSEKKRRASLTQTYDQAQIPLTRAVDAGHRFTYSELQEYLSVAQRRVTALLSALANP